MLIRGAELEGGIVRDVRIGDGVIAAIGPLTPEPHEATVEARGGCLLPGLHDHHIHIASTAASLESVRCGPPDVTEESELAAALNRPGTGWLRGIGYHESVAGMPDTAMLDSMAPERPVRIQHRSGRMWFFNSAGLDRLLAAAEPPPALERVAGRFTGRLFDADAWLKQALNGQPPDFTSVGAMLARRGVTGVTDMSPGNDSFMAGHFAAQRESGALPQRVLMAGLHRLSDAPLPAGIALGAAKLHLHEAHLPPYDSVVAFMRDAHRLGRVVAVHCVSEVELVFTLAAFAEAGTVPGDRIEHASVTPDSAADEIARLGLAVVSQPQFIAERGDAYLRDVEPEHHANLYRLAAFARRGVTLAAGSDAPFGAADPWASMAAAVSRTSRDGAIIGAQEALSPEAALDLYLRDPQDLGKRRRVKVGAPADLCLIDRTWREARRDLRAVDVSAVWIAGKLVGDRVDQAPL